jgi:hypothetical protein
MQKILLHLKSISINVSAFGLAAALYTAPIHPDGWFQLRKGAHSGYKSGYVARVLWLGFVLRWNAVKRFSRYGAFEKLIQQANDGDYL